MFNFLRRFAKSPTVDVTPPPFNPELFLRQLEWTAVRKLDGQLQGDFRTLFRGAGLMLADLREYQMHDDVRHIDWNVTARMRTPYVREHEEDREISIWFLVDLTGSIHFGSSAVTKQQLAINFVAVLARLFTRHGNRVGAILYAGPSSQASIVVPVRSGRKQVLHIIEQMHQLSEKQLQGETSLSDLFQLANMTIKRRSTVFVISDFISSPGWDKPIHQLSNRHDVIAARLLDPAENELPASGIMLIQDSETGEQVFVDSEDKGFRQRFTEHAEAHAIRLANIFAQSSVDCIELDTTESVNDALMRYLLLRKRKASLTRGSNLHNSTVTQSRAQQSYKL